MKARQHPRLAGIREQIKRATLLLDEAQALPDYRSAFRKLIAAVYPARAALEIMREAVKLGELTIPLDGFDRRVAELVPRYRLIHAVRIRDFHRYGVQGDGHILVECQVTVPPHGHAEFSMYPDPVNPRPDIHLSDSSGSYKFLLTSDAVVQDEREPEAVPYWVLLKEYLEGVDALAREFEALLRKPVWRATGKMGNEINREHGTQRRAGRRGRGR